MASHERYMLENEEKWRDWVNKIPFIPVEKDWEICPIPPFAGAMARFRVRHRDNPDFAVSVYLDVDGSLGVEDNPYWEIYPYEDDTARFAIDNVDRLAKFIAESLNTELEKLNERAD